MARDKFLVSEEIKRYMKETFERFSFMTKYIRRDSLLGRWGFLGATDTTGAYSASYQRTQNCILHSVCYSGSPSFSASVVEETLHDTTRYTQTLHHYSSHPASPIHKRSNKSSRESKKGEREKKIPPIIGESAQNNALSPLRYLCISPIEE